LIATAVALTAAVACARRPSPAADLDAAAESYVRIVLALAQRDPDSLDNYHGPAAWRADAEALRAPLADLQRSARSLAAALEGTSGGDATRRAFLVRQLRAVDARVDILKGARPTFDLEMERLFGVDAGGSTPASPGSADSDATLPDPRGLIVPRSRVRAVIEKALEGCRSATLKYVPLPPAERVTVELVPDLAWSAFTDYLGAFRSRIRINIRLPMTVDDALELACHEGYPGHHTIETLIEAKYGNSRAEFLIQPLFSPQALLHEGAASVAPSLAFTDEERVAFERDELFPLAALDPANAARGVRGGRISRSSRERQLGIVKRYLDGELDFPRASMALAREAPGSAPDETLKFVNEFRTYYATYVVGEAGVAAWLDRRAPENRRDRWYAFQQLVTAADQTIPDADKR
jgi:hypothetical protein